MRVLVVDDSPDIRFMLRVFLEDAGMDVEEAGSGPEALALLDGAERWPDALVLDHRMPGMTGVEVARELAGQGSDLPVVLFSAYLHPDLHAEARALGAVPVVKTDLGLLVEVLEGLLPCAA